MLVEFIKRKNLNNYDLSFNGYPQDKIKQFEERFLGKHKFAEWCRNDLDKKVDEVLPRYLIRTLKALYGRGGRIRPITKNLKYLKDSEKYMFKYKNMDFGLLFDVESHEATLYRFNQEMKVQDSFELELLKGKIVIK